MARWWREEMQGAASMVVGGARVQEKEMRGRTKSELGRQGCLGGVGSTGGGTAGILLPRGVQASATSDKGAL